MADRASGPRFLMKSCHRLLAPKMSPVEHFDGNATTDLQVFGTVYRSHSPFTDEFRDPVFVADNFSDEPRIGAFGFDQRNGLEFGTIVGDRFLNPLLTNGFARDWTNFLRQIVRQSAVMTT